jgi:hypothetical protein
MKRRFAFWTLLVISLSALAAGNAEAQTINVQLILEGPFAVCENAANKQLTIYVPNLEGTHYVAGFSAGLDELVPGNGSDYPTYPDGPDYLLNMTRSPNPTTLMVLKPADPNVHFYSENTSCVPNAALESFSVTVPDPDEIWALNPAADQFFVYEHQAPVPKRRVDPIAVGPSACHHHSCNYATKIVLRYNNVVPGSICFQDPKDAENPCSTTSNGAWRPNQNAAIGGEFEIELTAEPQPAQDYQSHAMAAFRQASNLTGAPRDLRYPQHPLNPPAHVVCQSPPLFFCQTGAACNQP